MARGKEGKGGKGYSSTLPRFVDVKLSQEQREAFVEWYSETADQVHCLQNFADSGYRIGVSWSGEHQTYTVSATCRDENSPNNGLCMTAFSSSLPKAIALLWYKHSVISEENWADFQNEAGGDFG